MDELADRDRDKRINELIDNYAADVWNYVFLLTKKTDVAEDLTQECFVRALVHLSSFRSESTVKTWLLKIARNLVYDHRRSSFVKRVVLTDRVHRNASSPSAESIALKRIVSDEVWLLTLSLPQKLREVLVLYGHHQLSIVEISRFLKISERAVRSRLHRARRQMRTLLAEEGGFYAQS